MADWNRLTPDTRKLEMCGRIDYLDRKLEVAEVMIHPDDAAPLRLQEGGDAILSKDTGELVLTVRLSEDVCPSVALSYKGRWPKKEKELGNVNKLNPGMKTDMGESTAVHGVEVTVTPSKKNKFGKP